MDARAREVAEAIGRERATGGGKWLVEREWPKAGTLIMRDVAGLRDRQADGGGRGLAAGEALLARG